MIVLPDDVHDLPVCEAPVLGELLDQAEESSEGDTFGGVGHEGDVQLHLDVIEEFRVQVVNFGQKICCYRGQKTIHILVLTVSSEQLRPS